MSINTSLISPISKSTVKAVINTGLTAIEQGKRAAGEALDFENIKTQLNTLYKKNFNMCKLNTTLEQYSSTQLITELLCRATKDTNKDDEKDKYIKTDDIPLVAMIINLIGGDSYKIFPSEQYERSMDRAAKSIKNVAANSLAAGIIVDAAGDFITRTTLDKETQDKLSGTGLTIGQHFGSVVSAGLLSGVALYGSVVIGQKITKKILLNKNKLVVDKFIKPLNLLCIKLNQDLYTLTEYTREERESKKIDFINQKIEEYKQANPRLDNCFEYMKLKIIKTLTNKTYNLTINTTRQGRKDIIVGKFNSFGFEKFSSGSNNVYDKYDAVDKKIIIELNKKDEVVYPENINILSELKCAPELEENLNIINAKEAEYINEYDIETDKQIFEMEDVIKLNNRLSTVKQIIANYITRLSGVGDGKLIYDEYINRLPLFAALNENVNVDNLHSILMLLQDKVKYGRQKINDISEEDLNNILFLSTKEYEDIFNHSPPKEWVPENIENIGEKIRTKLRPMERGFNKFSSRVSTGIKSAMSSVKDGILNKKATLGGKTHKQNKRNKTHKRRKVYKRKTKGH